MLINPKTLKIESKTNPERTVIAAIQRHGPTTAAAQAAGGAYKDASTAPEEGSPAKQLMEVS